MGSSKKNTDYFDNNFEVTYEEDVPFMYNLEKEKSRKKKKDNGPAGWDIQASNLSVSNPNTSDRYNGPDEYEQYNPYQYADHYDTAEEYDEEDTYDTSSDSRSSSGRRKKRQTHPTRLAAPIQKGGNAIYRVSQSVLRNLSVILFLAIIVLLAYNFIRGSAPYGDIEDAISTQTYSMMLAAYFSVAAVLILYELFSTLWAMTKVRVRDHHGSYKEDVGRGLFSFVFTYICSYAAFLTSRWIPETMDILIGIKGALDVFGSLHNALFGLCAAGVISCLFRKYSLSL